MEEINWNKLDLDILLVCEFVFYRNVNKKNLFVYVWIVFIKKVVINENYYYWIVILKKFWIRLGNEKFIFMYKISFVVW